MNAQLVSTVHPDVIVVLKQFPAVIGRNVDSAMSLDDRWVSRQHCEFDEVSGSLVIRDLKSRHGTLVNGSPVQEAVLKSGDRVTIGLSTFVAEIEEAQRAAAR